MVAGRPELPIGLLAGRVPMPPGLFIVGLPTEDPLGLFIVGLLLDPTGRVLVLLYPVPLLVPVARLPIPYTLRPLATRPLFPAILPITPLLLRVIDPLLLKALLAYGRAA